jgi:cytoskeletal protein RodZ
VKGDQVDEGTSETASLTLENPTDLDAGTIGGTNPAELTITDDDTAGVSVSKSALTVSEVGSTGTYEVVLTSQPTADVTISVSSDDTDEATVEPDTLTFTVGDWDTAQEVTVTGVNDDVACRLSLSHIRMRRSRRCWWRREEARRRAT